MDEDFDWEEDLKRKREAEEYLEDLKDEGRDPRFGPGWWMIPACFLAALGFFLIGWFLL